MEQPTNSKGIAQASMSFYFGLVALVPTVGLVCAIVSLIYSYRSRTASKRVQMPVPWQARAGFFLAAISIIYHLSFIGYII